MTLPSSGNSISLNQMHVEIGGTSGTLVSLNDSGIRGLIGKGAGVAMSFSEWFGVTFIPTSLSKTGVTPSTLTVIVDNFGMYHNRTYDAVNYTGGTNASFTESGQFKDSTGTTKTFVNFVHGNGYKAPSYVEISLLGHNHTDNWSVSAYRSFF